LVYVCKCAGATEVAPVNVVSAKDYVLEGVEYLGVWVPERFERYG